MNSETNREANREAKYRILGPDEVIQKGDEWEGFGGWYKCMSSIGETSNLFPPGSIRRPSVAPSLDELTRELADALEALLQVEKVMDDGDEPLEVARSKSRAALAKYKESIKVYDTIDGKVVKMSPETSPSDKSFAPVIKGEPWGDQ